LFYLFETYLILKTSDDESMKKTAVTFLILYAWPLLFHYPAALAGNLWCSRIAFLGVVFMMAYANIVQYPYPGECTITQCYQGQVVMAVMANLSLSFVEKMTRLGLLFLVGSYVSIQSPFSVYVEDALPILGGTILVAIFVLYVYHFSIARENATVQAARLALAGFFFYHTVVNMPEIHSTSSEKITSLSKMATLVCLGAVAMGTFQQKVLQKEQLEILVRKRTQKLYMVNMALQASETAVVIANENGSIVWLNKAFATLCGKNEKSLTGMLIKDVIYDCDPSRKENKFAMMESYEDASRARETELQIGKSIYAHESTPFPEHKEIGQISTDNNRFLMVFKDITAGRAREDAEQKAQEKAMMAKAMGEAMVTLTHELRTPLQVISMRFFPCRKRCIVC
jgi:PAS domain-containing protein